MLQRIQTVFLFLAFVAGVLIFFFPIATYDLLDGSKIEFYLQMVREISKDTFKGMVVNSSKFNQWFTLPLSAGQLVIIVLLFVSIFKYKKRTFQIRMNNLCILINVLLVGGVFYYSTFLEKSTGTSSHYQFGAVFPLISIIFLFLANYNIRKDEKLIRSADRLR